MVGRNLKFLGTLKFWEPKWSTLYFIHVPDIFLGSYFVLRGRNGENDRDSAL